MGAVADLYIVSKKFINIQEIVTLLACNFRIDVRIRNIEIMDDWKYSNVISIIEIDKIIDYIEMYKIANIQFCISDKWNAGCQIEKIENKYVTNLWLNTSKLEYLDCNFVNEDNKLFYEEVTNIVLKSIDKYNILISSIGIETSFRYDEDISGIINKSNNPIRWIVADNSLKSIKNYYFKEYCELNVGIFTRFK